MPELCKICNEKMYVGEAYSLTNTESEMVGYVHRKCLFNEHEEPDEEVEPNKTVFRLSQPLSRRSCWILQVDSSTEQDIWSLTEDEVKGLVAVLKQNGFLEQV